MGKSLAGTGDMEGLVIRSEADGFVKARAKLVAAKFTQQIEDHWSRGPVRHNSLAPGVSVWQ